MLRCLAGICGGDVPAPSARPLGPTSGVAESFVYCAKPTLKVREEYAPALTSLEALEPFGLESAPPGIDPPLAAVTADFRKNPSRLLVIVPSPSASSWGVWDDTVNSLSSGAGSVVPVVRWAVANGYAVVLFSGKMMEAEPTKTWDSIMKHSPARIVSAIVAVHAEPMFRAALSGLHSLLYTRLRTVVVVGPIAPYGTEAETPRDLKIHLERCLASVPEPWMRLDAFTMHQCIFQLLEERVDRWQKNEAKKYSGFRDMKENDVPGLKRMDLDTRIKRLDRNREDDELARLLRKHHEAANLGAEEEEEEPGVD